MASAKTPGSQPNQSGRQQYRVLEQLCVGYGTSYTPDTFTKAYNSLVKYVGSGGLDKYGGPDAASVLRKFKVPKFVPPKPPEEKGNALHDTEYAYDVKQCVENESTWTRMNKKVFNLL